MSSICICSALLVMYLFKDLYMGNDLFQLLVESELSTICCLYAFRYAVLVTYLSKDLQCSNGSAIYCYFFN